MNPIHALRMLIREDLETEPEAPQEKNFKNSLSSSELYQSFKKDRWQKLIVYSEGRLWEVEPGRGGRGFVFHQLRLQRMPDPIAPASVEELLSVEKALDLDLGVKAPHVTIIKDE